MRLRALNINAIDYVLECQEKDSNKTTFKLKPLSAKQQAILQDFLDFEATRENIAALKKDAEKIEKGKATEAETLSIMKKIKNFNQYLNEVLKCGLIGWDNFLDEDDKPIKFSPNLEENTDRIPGDYRTELSLKILDISTLKEVEKKK